MIKSILPSIPALCAISLLTACGDVPKSSSGSDEHGFSEASSYTQASNRQVAKHLPLADQSDFDDARRGLIARAQSLRITTTDGRAVWDQDAYQFLDEAAPSTANPSLWRQEQLNGIHGLFEVTPGIYQLRGFDLANMTLIDSDSGWIVVDPLTSADTARYALDFARQHLGSKPVAAVIFTHSHIDHFGGIDGVLTSEELDGLEIIAPVGFMAEAVSENLLAGIAMQRRAQYMYGLNLPVSPRGHIGTGLGKAPANGGKIGIRAPTTIVDQTGQTLTVDGVEFVFQNAPGSEAPAELMFYLPQHRAFCGGEVVSRNMHNLYTLRGAKVRDALAWSNYIEESLQLFGGKSEIYFGTHHWPLWGSERIKTFLKRQRDTYKFIHDQTLRMANRGFTPREIAEQLQLPSTLQNSFANRGYYGSLSHNSKAVYQHYFGWYDANPANLNPLPPVDAAQRYVELMGGEQQVVIAAQKAFEEGEYRWVAELLNHVVFTNPDNPAAKQLLARAYDQMAYQAESAPWRDVYLSGAYELRHGKPAAAERNVMAEAQGLLQAIPTEQFFAAMATNLNAEKADGKHLRVSVTMTDSDETYVLEVENSVLHHYRQTTESDVDASLSMTRQLFLKVITQQASMKELVFGDELEVQGSPLALIGFFSLFDQATGGFNIVTP